MSQGEGTVVWDSSERCYRQLAHDNDDLNECPKVAWVPTEGEPDGGHYEKAS